MALIAVPRACVDFLIKIREIINVKRLFRKIYAFAIEIALCYNFIVPDASHIANVPACEFARDLMIV